MPDGNVAGALIKTNSMCECVMNNSTGGIVHENEC